MHTHILSRGYRRRRLVVSPFDSVGILEWCKQCKMDVDVEISKGRKGGVDVYRKRCKRCGKTLQYGVDRRHLTGNAPLLNAEVQKWINETGKDRR